MYASAWSEAPACCWCYYLFSTYKLGRCSWLGCKGLPAGMSTNCKTREGLTIICSLMSLQSCWWLKNDTTLVPSTMFFSSSSQVDQIVLLTDSSEGLGRESGGELFQIASALALPRCRCWGSLCCLCLGGEIDSQTCFYHHWAFDD